jgi:nitrogen fixation NifU-like protein
VESDLDAFVANLQGRVIRDARELYSEEVVRRWLDTPHAGVMDDPDARARITGPCGDTMEVFLAASDGRVAGASFVTDGCAPTIACGSTACDLALGRPVAELVEVTQETILAALGGLPEESRHCALLAATALQAAGRDWASRSGLEEEAE